MMMFLFVVMVLVFHILVVMFLLRVIKCSLFLLIAGAKGVTLSQTKKLCVTCGVVSFVSQAKKKLCVVYGFLGSS